MMPSCNLSSKRQGRITIPRIVNHKILLNGMDSRLIIFGIFLNGCTNVGTVVNGQGALVNYVLAPSKEKAIVQVQKICPSGYSIIKEGHATASVGLQFICTTNGGSIDDVQLAQTQDSATHSATQNSESQAASYNSQEADRSATNGNDASSSNTESSAETISAVASVFGGLLNLKAAKEAAGAVRAERIAAQHAALAAQAAQFAAAQAAAEQRQQAAQRQAQLAAQQQAQFVAQQQAQAAAQQASAPKPSNQVTNNAYSSGSGVNTFITGYATNGPSPFSPPQFTHSYVDQCSDSSDPSSCVFNVYVTNQSAAGINCTVSVSLQRYNSATGGTDTLSASDRGYVPAGQTSTISSNIASGGQYSNLQCAY